MHETNPKALGMKSLQEIENIIILLKNAYRQNISPNDTLVKAIYLFGSYPRNDFVIGCSDLDFAVILEVPKNSPHWSHPNFHQIVDLTRRSIKLPPQFLRKPGIDIISLSCLEIELAKKNELKTIIGPLKLLTFFAFDFLVHNFLLWGKDLLHGFPSIPNPNQFASERLKWIRSFYFKKTNWTGSETERLLMILGSIVRHFAVVKGGVRTLKRNALKQWALTYEKWSENNPDVLIPYFEFIEGRSKLNPADDDHWRKKVQQFITLILNQNY